MSLCTVYELRWCDSGAEKSEIKMHSSVHKQPWGRVNEKEFRVQPSLITERVCSIPDVWSFRNIFTIVTVVGVLCGVADDIATGRVPDFGFERLAWVFGQPGKCALIVGSLNLGGICIFYPGFRWWVQTRNWFRNAAVTDSLAVVALVCYVGSLLVIPAWVLWTDPLPFGSGMLIAIEQCRLGMKVLAFTRYNVPRVLLFHSMRNVDIETPKGSTGDYGYDFDLPTLSQYTYFLYAPTLLYRDQYPRTERVRWSAVLQSFTEVAWLGYFTNCMLGRALSSRFSQFGTTGHRMNLVQLLAAILNLMIPALLSGIVVFFGILLHSWQNAFAELLRFGDRGFYKDWWNCSHFGNAYRSWNILVHEWLHVHIFQEIANTRLGRKCRLIPVLAVFFISAVFHEYVIIISFHFFCPILFVLFGLCGFLLHIVGNRRTKSVAGHVFLWVCIMLGASITMAAYSMEFYAQINCKQPREDGNWARRTLVPRLLTCNAISFSFDNSLS